MIKVSALRSIIALALREDIGKRDITTDSLIPGGLRTSAKVQAKESGVLCGLDILREVFSGLKVKCMVSDGDWVRAGKVLARIEGEARTLLTRERVALNFLGHLSGIATLTRKFVEQVKPYKVKIMDTRKTTPGLRALEKYAVRCGGGYNHRMRLDEMVLIKDNHLKCLGLRVGESARPIHRMGAPRVCGSAGQRVYESASQRVSESAGQKLTGLRKRYKRGQVKIEVEVKNLNELKAVVEIKPDIIMFDNMTPAQVKGALEFLKGRQAGYPSTSLGTGRLQVEVSGNITLNNVREYASLGVDMISIGSLTHSAPALDISLEIQ